MINKEALIHDLTLLSKNFYKIIEVNLNEDTYFEVKVDDAEPHIYSGLKKWVDAFVSVRVHPEDRDNFKAFFNLVISKENVNKWQRIYYRRKIDDSWRMVCMEVVPFENYSAEDALVLLTVRDVEDYIKDFRTQYN